MLSPQISAGAAVRPGGRTRVVDESRCHFRSAGIDVVLGVELDHVHQRELACSGDGCGRCEDAREVHAECCWSAHARSRASGKDVEVDGQVDDVGVVSELRGEVGDFGDAHRSHLGIRPVAHAQALGFVEQDPRVAGVRNAQHRVVELFACLFGFIRQLKEWGARGGFICRTQVEVGVEVDDGDILAA